MACAKCGRVTDAASGVCAACDAGGDSPVKRLIPTGNPHALFAYYLGVFSVIPVLGVLLGIPAFFLGLRGLRVVKERPEAYGKVHAWVGNVMGGLFGFGYLVAILVVILVALSR